MYSHRLILMNARTALLSCAILTVISFPALAVDTTSTGKMQVTRVGDTDMGCNRLSKEAAAMRDIIIQNETLKKDAKMQGYGVNAAAGIGSLIVGTVTGGIGFAAAGFLASEAIDEDAEEAQAISNAAAQRRSFMMGIFKAKGCYGPIEHVMQKPVDETTETALVNIEPAAGERQPRYND